MFDTTPWLQCGTRRLDLSQTVIMGVLNVTPDSFSDGGQFVDVSRAVAHGLAMHAAGAAILDVGGESTRPGAREIDAATEIERVLPVVRALHQQCDAVISIDTSKPEVMRAAVEAGAGMINDVWALRRPGALDAAAACAVPVCLMHMQGEPGSMQQDPSYSDVVSEVHRFLADRALACQFAGIDKSRIVIDPGFGFGKTLEHNLSLLAGLDRLTDLGFPILAGLSRKSMIGALTGREIDQREAGSVAAALIAVQRGARFVRVHDVAATRDALAVWRAVDAAAARQAPRTQASRGPASLFDDD